MPENPYQEQVRCAKRELALRQRVYPRWVAARTMTQDTADREIAAMAAIVATLTTLHDDAMPGMRDLFGVEE